MHFWKCWITLLLQAQSITKHFSWLFRKTELKFPIRIAATGLTDMEENTKPTKSDLAGAEKGPCCACQKTPEEKDREKDDRVFLKIFENFLHNSIFLPRYSKPQMATQCQPHSVLLKLFTAPAL